MRKNKFLISLFFFVIGVNAQTNFSWFPFHPNTYYNYKIDSAAVPISAVIKIDSVTGSSSPRYHLNKIVTGCDTCHNALLVNDPYDTTYVLSNQPQFAGHSFSKTSPAGFYFKGPRSFVLQPFSAAGASWLFDSTASISATLVFKGIQPVLGTNDSICIITLSSNDTIVLSKNSGIVQFPFYYSSPRSYKLTGIEGTSFLGQRLKRFHDFFDFQAGTVFQYSFRDDDFNILPPLLKSGRERWDILSANIYADSVRYKIRQTYYDSLKLGGGPPTITAYTHTLHVSFTDSLQHIANFYPSQEVRADPYFLYYNGLKYIHKLVISTSNSLLTKSFGEVCPNVYLSPGATGAAVETAFTHVFLNKNSQKLVGRELTEGLGVTSELYNDYSRIYQRCLIGYIKNADTNGTIYESNPLALKTNTLPEHAYSVYPVPTHETAIITGALPKGTRLSIIDSFGKILHDELILNHAGSFSLDVSQLPAGLYFLKINAQDASIVKKIIVCR